ncbi:MAG: ATP-dependent DNA helicase RecQ [Candidatus Riflebacteria bacterium]|nr:ATP-dependent DNA helicase RecQ [Candidatus Riflebacteria bacterium]
MVNKDGFNICGKALEEKLEQKWGFSAFRPLQREAIEAALSGRDALVVLPTGGGKSLCYQLPAVCGIGLVVVISPLIALMDDQVTAARQIGLKAGALHSQTNEKSRKATFAELYNDKLELLYISPERLVGGGLLDLIRRNIGMFAVDEAHCVSHWGHEFRPEYRQLGGIFSDFPDTPRLALTATATPVVQKDICAQLGLRDPISLIGHPDRPNLVYRAFPRHDQTRQVIDVIKRHPGEGGIVYSQTRREVDRLALGLAKAGVSCAPYHAGLSANDRARAQDDFVHERLDVIVATIAFGMGIDRSNVRYVVHANTPKSIEHYQQESGRAGRDGDPAECVLFFSVSDLITHRALSLRDDGISPERRRALERNLNEIARYAISPVCRHRLLAEHFGKPYPPSDFPVQSTSEGCGACDVCLGETQALPDAEALLTSQKIISAVFRTESRFGATYVVKVLLGREDERILANGHSSLKVFGLMKDSTDAILRSWIDQLVVQGHLMVTEGEYPLLKITQSGLNLCRGQGTVRLGLPSPRLPKSGRRQKVSASVGSKPGDTGTPLFEKLRRLRLLFARKLAIPPYMVFPDSVLTSMSLLKPTNLQTLRQIKGIGDQKRDRYGSAFLEIIAGGDPDEVAEKFGGDFVCFKSSVS